MDVDKRNIIQLYAFGSAQEGEHGIVEEIGDSAGKSRQDKRKGALFAHEVLRECPELTQFLFIGPVDLIDGDDQAHPALLKIRE